MLYMVIEKFKDAPAIYERLEEKGRMMPEGLKYVSSWIDHQFKTCWQVMETDDFVLLERWIDNWKDLMDFEIVPVHTSAEAREMIGENDSSSPVSSPSERGKGGAPGEDYRRRSGR